jgi:hypothetical protein
VLVAMTSANLGSAGGSGAGSRACRASEGGANRSAERAAAAQQEAERLKAMHEARVKIVPRI